MSKNQIIAAVGAVVLAILGIVLQAPVKAIVCGDAPASVAEAPAAVIAE